MLAPRTGRPSGVFHCLLPAAGLSIHAVRDMIRPHVTEAPTPAGGVIARQRLGGVDLATRDAKAVVLITLGTSAAMAAAHIAGHVATGSSVLMASGTQAVAGASIAAMLLFGGWRANVDRVHELDFWSLVAPVLPLAIGAGYTIFEGFDRLRSVRPLEQPQFAYAALGVAAIFAALAVWSVSSALNARMLSVRRFSEVRSSGQPVLFALLLAGLAALIGIVVASAGVLAADRLQWRDADGLATIAVGAMMAAVAALFAVETKSLITRGDVSPAAEAATLLTGENNAASDGPTQLLALSADGGGDVELHSNAQRKSRKKARRTNR